MILRALVISAPHTQPFRLCDRLTKLRNTGKLEEAAVSVLQHIGQVKRPYLTPLEEKLLSVLEQEYGVENE